MTKSVEEHFEENPKKPKTLLFLLGGLVLIAALVGFAIWTLPHPRPEFVGKWIGQRDSQAHIDFHADGTYESRLAKDAYDPARSAWIASEGTWTASHDNLYLTVKSMHSDGKIKGGDLKEFFQETIGQTLKLRVNWQSPSQWFLDQYSDNPFVRKR